MSPDFTRITATMKQAVRERAGNYCEYCCCPGDYSSDTFTVDHIIPRQAGGETTLKNLAWSCYGCNGRKHTRTRHVDPETNQDTPLFNPREQSWFEHFGWSEDFIKVFGKTPCGRATIAALELNRSGVVNLRQLLVSANLHPPALK